MYALLDQHGNWACSEKTGARFVYHSPELAEAAAKALGKKYDTRYRVVDA